MYLLRGVQRAQHLGKVAVQARSYRVCIADPRIILNQPEAALDTAAGKALMIDVPDAFADKLSRGAQAMRRRCLPLQSVRDCIESTF